MALKIFKRGKIWHFSGTVARRRLRGSTGTTDQERAKRIAAEQEARAWKSRLDGPGAGVTFAQAAIAYRDAEKSTRFLEPVEDYWKDTAISEITPGAIRLSAIKLYPNAGPATRNRHAIVPTAAIINYAAELGWCNTIKVKRFPSETKVKKPITLEWVVEFAKHSAPHLGALCYFMFGTGARIGEAVELRWRDVDFSKAEALIRQSKVQNERIANLPPPVLAAISSIPSNRNPDEKVFRYVKRDSVRQPWIAACKRAGIEQLSSHCCRHGFATSLLHEGVDIVTVAKAGGWKDVSQVAKTYGHAMDDKHITNRLFGQNGQGFGTKTSHNNSYTDLTYSKERNKS